MKYTTIVFDCDGTLLDTSTDLYNSVNYVLSKHNFPEKSLSEVKAALGNAVTYLMRQCLPSTVADHELEPYIEEFKAYYGEHLKDTTAPYPGILDMLDALREKGYKLAIVSNKIQEGVTPLNKEYFGNRLPIAIGERPGLQRKPAPDMVLQALKELCLSENSFGNQEELIVYISEQYQGYTGLSEANLRDKFSKANKIK